MNYFNSERVYVYSLIFLLLLLPNMYFFIDQFVNFINGMTDDFWNRLVEIIVYLSMILIYSNLMSHIIMESNFKLVIKEEGFTYKTFLRLQKTNVSYNSIKKVIICPETLVFKGEFESIILIRKGLRRNLFFTEYAMKKKEYDYIKQTFKNICPERVIISKKKYVKSLFMLFSK